MLMGLHILMGASLLAGSFLLVRYLARYRIISTALKRGREQLQEQAWLGSRRYFGTFGTVAYGEKETGFGRLDQKLQYSGLRHTFPFLTVEMYLFFLVLSAGIGYFLMLVLSGRPFLSLLALGCGPCCLQMLVSALCLKNYRQTEAEMTVLLNLLDSYSITASDLHGILYRISPFLREPLRTTLEECYYEVQTTGDTARALEHMTGKLEHPLFCQLVKNLEMSSRYNADYSSVVQGSRRSVQDYLAYRRKKKAISNVAKAEMTILGLAAAASFGLMGFIMNADIWNMLFHTGIGNGLLLFMAGVLLLFFWQVVLFDHD